MILKGVTIMLIVWYIILDYTYLVKQKVSVKIRFQ